MDPFEDCVKKGRLKAIEPDAERVASELERAREELERARACYVNGNWDEATMQSYFAMYRCARAAINSRGYRDTNLYGLCHGLQRLFIDPEGLSGETVKRIREAKDVKDAVYSGHRASPRSARNLLAWALELAKGVFSRISLPGFDADAIELALPEPPDHERTHTTTPPRRPFRREEWRPYRRY